MLSDKEIQHIADLARIELTDNEKEKFKKDLSSILDYINQLNEADTSGVEPLYQTTGLVNSMRSDDPRGDFKMDETLNELLIGQAPYKKERFVKVKSVLNAK